MSKHKKAIFRGAATALITPFREGRIDFDALDTLIERQTSTTTPMGAIVMAGTTGESATMSDPEKVALFAYTAERVHGKLPLIAGVGCADTAHTVRMARAAAGAGADALLVVTPYYTRPTQAGLRAHYEAIADACDKPVIIYSVPGRTGIKVSLDTYDALADHPNIVAVKEASTDMSEVGSLIQCCGDRLDIYSGNDDLTIPTLALGGVGVISVLGNVVPEAVADICRLWFDGKVRLAAARHAKYRDLGRALFAETNPVPVKSALSLLGLCREEFRLPLTPPSDTTRDALRRELQALKLL